MKSRRFTVPPEYHDEGQLRHCMRCVLLLPVVAIVVFFAVFLTLLRASTPAPTVAPVGAPRTLPSHARLASSTALAGVRCGVLGVRVFAHCCTGTGMGVTKEILKEGNGVKPQKGQKVTVHCTGVVQATGKKFWSTKDPGQQLFSFSVGLGQVIKVTVLRACVACWLTVARTLARAGMKACWACRWARWPSSPARATTLTARAAFPRGASPPTRC